uniref:Early endosome antigen 1 n=1 Tax=Salmo trutta TaxID=8032 RepID=A0A673X225_SALTR
AKQVNYVTSLLCLLSLPQTPGKGGSQNSESDQPSADLNNDQTSEGFICPQCMKSHNSEERWFSGELKKELDKVQGHLKQVIPLRSLAVKLNQAEMEKFNITQMKDLLEQKAAQLATEIVDIKSRYDEEKSLREAADQRLANLIQELQRERQDKDRLHTQLLQRPGVEDMEVLQKELIQVQTLMDNMTREREEESVRLKSQYEQLQSVHTTSEMTISQLKAELEKGPQEAAVYTQQIHQLQSSLNNLQQQSQMLSETLGRREKEFQELEDCLGAEQASKKTAQASLHQTEMEVQELQARVAGAEASLQRAQAELGEEAGRLRREVAELEAKHGQVKAERKQLQQQREERESQGLVQQSEINQLHAKLLEAERQLGEVQGRLKEQRQLSGEKLKDREQQTADLQIKLSRSEEQLKENSSKMLDLQHQLEKAKQQHQELQGLQQNTNTKLREAQNDLEQVLRQIGDKDQKIQNLEALLQKTKDSVSQLEAEREDLVAKIQAGEGETAVLNQLQEKNHTLQTQVGAKLKNQSESHKQAQDNLHKQVQEQKSLLRAAQDRAQAVETSLGELNAQLTENREKVTQLDTQLKSKTEMLLSAEAAKAAQRVDLENHLETAQHALQDKQQVSHWLFHFVSDWQAEKGLKMQLTVLTEQHTKTQDALKEKEKGVQQLQTQLKTAQGSFNQENKKLESQVSELQGAHAKKAEEEGRLNEQVSGLGQELSSERTRTTELQKALEQSQGGLAKMQSDYYGKESEVSSLRQDLASEERLTLSQEELAANRTQLTGLEGQVQEVEAARTSLKQELAKRDQRLGQQETALKELQKHQVRPRIVFKQHRSSRELGEAKQLLIQQKLEVQGRVEEVQAALEQEKTRHQATRDSVTQREEKSRASERKAREEQAKRGEEAEARLGLQVTALNENVATLKREWQGSQRRCGELEKQTDELRGEIAVLEATVQNNQDERRALLERCVKGEGEMEKLQSKVVEMRRKLDDTTAAMQELGRENQSLQIKQSQSLTRKWAEDHEVQNCMACGKGFSLAIRKHHCRHCGNIFCAECSAKNAFTPSSKKPVRVCETCFEDLQG